ncbi:MAG: fenitrothion hydrolase [Actinomycetota bacterium]|nr:fenitrothion hydrolase [Actinomycetota bacterium]
MRVVLAASAALLIAPASASAHGVVGRADLPIPPSLFAAGAAAVLVLSFVALAALWSRPRLAKLPAKSLVLLPRWVDVTLGALGVALLAAVVVAGLWGAQGERENLAPTLVFIVFWVGVPVVSLVFGDVFRLLSPWRAIARATAWLAGKAVPGLLTAPHPYPWHLGRWPAAAGLFAFAVCELVWAPGREPDTLAVLALLYLGAQLAGMAIFGIEAWSRNGDAFGVWFTLVAALSPFKRREGSLHVRVPGSRLAREPSITGTAAVLCVMIASTAFDSLRETELFASFGVTVQQLVVGAGTTHASGLALAMLAGLILTLIAVALTYLAAVCCMSETATKRRRRELVRAMAPTLVPIAAAYLVAHYFSLLAFSGQDAWRLASDPLGAGTDFFGTASAGIDYSVVSATALWYVQLGALLIGHVFGLVLGHDRALELHEGASAATRSQLVMLVLMVCFTVLGLSLLSEASA